MKVPKEVRDELRRLHEIHEAGMADYLAMPDGPEKGELGDRVGDHAFVLQDQATKALIPLLDDLDSLATTPPSIDSDLAIRLQRAKAALAAMTAPVTEAEVEQAFKVWWGHPAFVEGAFRAVLIDFLTSRIAERQP